MENTLNIVTYNIHHGLKGEKIIENIYSLTLKKVSVFCLQEVRENDSENFIVSELLKKLGKKWKAEHIIKPNSNDLGLCILWDSSVLKALRFENLLLPKLSKLYFYESGLQKAMKDYPRPVQRVALIGEFKYENIKLRISNVHLDWQGGLKQRTLQLKHLYFHLNLNAEYNHEIICGDFNTVGFYKFAEKRMANIRNILENEYENILHKKPSTNYFQTLDHVFVKNLKINKIEVIKYKGSDHFPVLAEIEIIKP